jgi:hypothetical protein
MIRDMKARDLEQLFTKLRVKTKECSHHVRGFVEHDGRAVLPVHYSHGKGLHGPNLQKFRKSLHVDQDQFYGLVTCTFSREDYISALKGAGIA